MGKIEIEHKRRERIGRTERIIIQSIKVAGVLALALCAPNALQILKPFRKSFSTKEKRPIYESVRRLKKAGLVLFRSVDGRKVIQLTEEGIERALFVEETDKKLSIPSKWDGKWRVVIFDVTERRRHARRKFRELIKKQGFFRIQDSVWVYPYDCEDFIVLIRTYFKIGKEVVYIIADNIENDRLIRSHFSLPLEEHQ